MNRKPPKYIVIEDEHGDSQWLEWPDPEEAAYVSTRTVLWWLFKLFLLVTGGTLAILYLVMLVWG